MLHLWIFCQKIFVSKKFEAVLCKVDMDFFNNHIEQKDKVQLFFYFFFYTNDDK
ncbi:unnamed protein product, partial [Larinioides sclopetarius]